MNLGQLTVEIYPGKVLLGKYRDTNGAKAGHSLWATFRLTAGGRVMVVLFDDAFNLVNNHELLSDTINLDRVFWLVTGGNPKAELQLPKRWTAKMSCA